MTDLAVAIEDVSHRYQDEMVLDHVSFTVQRGEFLTILGPSGSGKSTLLQLVAGLTEPTEGRVKLGGRDVAGVPAQRRNVGFVFQSYALFPHLTVAQNIAFPLRVRGDLGKAAAARRTSDVIEMIELGGYQDRYPSQLSGGQQQRVAIGRAIAGNPDVLLLDEPLGALDRRLRQSLGTELRRIQQETGVTAIYVTHDQEEAFAMSDRIAVLHEGRLQQCGTPPQVYRRPQNLFVARFLGDLTIVRGRVALSDDSAQVVSGSRVWCSRAPSDELPADRDVVCVIRPENVNVHPGAAGLSSDIARAQGRVRSVVFQGGRRQVTVESGEDIVVAEVAAVEPSLDPGLSVSFGWRDEDVVVLPADDQTRAAALLPAEALV
jgi:ABC-type Fe3+/spermidine/putrescine transport system ATPase subunit